MPSLLTSRTTNFALLAVAALFPGISYAVGAGGETAWPEGATVAAQLKISASTAENGQPKINGDLTITNPGATALTIHAPANRRALAFIVFDSLGNLVPPRGVAKIDPAFATLSLDSRSTHTYHFEGLEFVTGSALFRYDLARGELYRVVAVYRPAGPTGPGFTTQEVKLQIPP